MREIRYNEEECYTCGAILKVSRMHYGQYHRSYGTIRVWACPDCNKSLSEETEYEEITNEEVSSGEF